MKLTEQQLRGVIQQVIAEAPKKKAPVRRRRPGGGRAALGFSIPEDSPSFGKPRVVDKKLSNIATKVRNNALRVFNEKVKRELDIDVGTIKMYADDFVDAYKVADALEWNGIKKAINVATHMDTAARDNLAFEFWQLVNDETGEDL